MIQSPHPSLRRWGLNCNNMRYLWLIFAILLTCCRRDPGTETDPVVAPRTLIAYLCGDNNLSAEVDIKIMALRQGMERIGPTDANLIVYADYRDREPELLRITHHGRTTLKQLPETNSASAQNFRRTLEEIVAHYPARSYGLICFSHATGWLPQGALTDPAGFHGARSGGVGAPEGCEDTETMPMSGDGRGGSPATRTIFEDDGVQMPLADFAAALPLPEGRKFDFILFETCYMAGVEVAYELRDKAEYVVASAAEILSDGFVEVYPQGVAMLMQPDPDLRGFARSYFEAWNAKDGAYRSATISVIKTQYLNELAAAVGEVCANGAEVDAASVQHFNRHAHHLFFDLSDAVGAMAAGEQKERFDAALGRVVEYAAATPSFMLGQSYSFTIRKHCGLTVYIPQPGFPALNRLYGDLGWCKAVGTL